MRLDASGRWFICLTVFRVGHEVEGALKASGPLPFLQKQRNILDLQRYPKTVFQVSRFRKRVLGDSLGIPGLLKFIASEESPWCSRNSECHRGRLLQIGALPRSMSRMGF